MPELLTLQDLANGHLDVKALGEAANGDENTIVTTRTGNTYPSAERAINIMFQNGGLPATPFATKALMTASALADGKYAQVTDDTVNNGLYVKTAGAWVKSGYDPLAQANTYTDSKVKGVTNNFKTKALMTTSPLPNESVAVVTEDAEANNGWYRKVDDTWIESKYDVGTYVLSEVDKKLKVDTTADVAHVFVDKNNKVLASIDSAGNFDLNLSEEGKNKVNHSLRDNNAEELYVVVDDNDRVLLSIDKEGAVDLKLSNNVKKQFGKSLDVINEDNYEGHAMVFLDRDNKILGTIPPMEGQGSSESTGEQLLYPANKAQPSVSVLSMVELTDKMALDTIAKGRSTDPNITVRGDGFTHPKMIFIPGGWNGYAYWLAATPVFGVIPPTGAAYENPHVFASNDLVTWVEPAGGRLDQPEEANSSYWSDTHLEIGDDGYMYCWYRGNGFSFNQRLVVYKRSRDGVNWSDRVIVNKDGGTLSAANLLLSPAIHRDGVKWVCYDLLRSDDRGLVFPETESTTKTHVFRRTLNNPSDEFGAYNENQIVNYSPRLWGVGTDPWHIDSIKVGNMYFHLLAVGDIDFHMSKKLYLAWSTDGWNFTVLPRLETGTIDDYRSSLTVTKVGGGEVELKMVNAKLDGTLKLHNLIIGVK